MAGRTREVTIKLAKLHPMQEHVKATGARYNVCSMGRRWGKSFLAEDLTADPLLEGLPVGYFAPTYKLLVEFWQACVRLYKPIIRKADANQHRIELITGGVLEMWTLQDKDAGRSRKYKRVIIDEAGLSPSLKTIWVEAIRPTLADLRGDAWFMGTPKGRNAFFEFYSRGQDPLQERWASWQMPTHTNPFIDGEELDELRQEMTERAYQQEILAEFLEDGGVVFRNVSKVSTLDSQEGPIPGHTYVIGVDWARTDDYTVFSIIDATAGAQAHVERFSGLGFELQYGRFTNAMDFWKPVQVIGEYNSMGGPLIERAQGAGYPVTRFVTTNASKAKLVDELALTIEQGNIALLDDDAQKFELMAYDSTVLPSGLIRYSAPDGQHDDMVMALALAWHGAKGYKTVEIPEPTLSDDERHAALVERLTGKKANGGSVATGW